MQINNISQQPSFTSIYKIENYPVKTGQKTLEYIIKDIENNEKSTKLFVGNNPVEKKYIENITKDLKQNNYSYNYFKRHIQNNKINVPDANFQNVWIFTNKDKKLIGKFYKKFNKKINYDNSLISNKLKSAPKESYKISYLFSKNTLHNLDKNSYATEIFKDLIKNKKIIDLSELFNINHEIILPIKNFKDNILKIIKKIF